MENEISTGNEGKPQYDYNTFIGTNLPTRTVDKLRDFQRRYRLKTRTQAMQQLLDIGFFVESKLGLVNSITNEELEEIKEQIESRQIVDYVAHLDLRQFNLLMNIFKDEETARFKSKQ